MKKITLIIGMICLLSFQNVNSGLNKQINLDVFRICKTDVKQHSNNKKRLRIRATSNQSYLRMCTDKATDKLELIKKYSKEYGVKDWRCVAYLHWAESNYGENKAAKLHNVHFGIKCHGQSGKYYKDDCKDKLCCFRDYKNFEESLKDFFMFLKNNPRYEKVKLFESNTAREFVVRLKQAGYATDPNYVAKFDKQFKQLGLNEL